MKTKKQIDRLFRERFKDFEVSPPPQAWENIAAALQQKKKSRRVIPLWYRVTGVAALFLIFFSLGNHFIFNNPVSNSPGQEITDTEKTQPQNTDNRNNIVENSLPETDAEILNEKPGAESTTKKQTGETLVAFEEETTKDSKANKDFYAQNKTDKTTVSTDIRENPEQTITDTAHGIAENKEKATTETEQKNELFTVPQDTEEEIAAVKEENKKSLTEYLEERNKAQEEIALADNETQNRWMITPNVAPVYYNSLGGGSSIDSQFSDSPKSGEINYSYGIHVGYAISDKLSVRTGLNKVEVGYATNNVEFAAAPASAGIRAINYGGAAYIVAVGPTGTLPDYNGPVPTIDGQPIVPRSEATGGTLNQHLGYFEIPLELKYNLVNSRFGVSMVGGMSTLILNENDISVTSSGFETLIGSAANLNPVSFSANFGVGLDYKISKRFVFNIEPMFKYQVNTYSDSNVDFKPYFLGVYSGLSFKF